MARILTHLLLALLLGSARDALAGAPGVALRGALLPAGGQPPLDVVLVFAPNDAGPGRESALAGYLALGDRLVLRLTGSDRGSLRVASPCIPDATGQGAVRLTRTSGKTVGSLKSAPGGNAPCGQRIPDGRLELAEDPSASPGAALDLLHKRFTAQTLRLAGEALLENRDANAFDAVESLEAALAVAREAFPGDGSRLAGYAAPLAGAYVRSGNGPAAKALVESFTDAFRDLPERDRRRLEDQLHPPLTRGASDERRYDVVRVFYATDREKTPSKDANNRYGSAPAATTTYGHCDVAIPSGHAPGRVEAPPLVSLTLAYDPNRHVAITAIKELSAGAFLTSIRENAAGGRRDILVFIHGYSVSFDRAVRRMAQMAFDMRFAGTPVVYSWPSDGLIQNYARDEEKATLSVPRLKAFIDLLARQTDPARIHIIAHSMGNRVLLGALQQFGLSRGQGNGPLVNNVILAAPDVDSAVFKNDIAPRIGGLAGNTTLYASSRDVAMLLSRLFNSSTRLGDAEDIIATPPLQSIDASLADAGVIGHSYYGKNHAVLDDMHLLIQGLKPWERPMLAPAKNGEGQDYWRFRAR